jgi:hypothetical protein
VRGMHRRWRTNAIAAAEGGGFVVAGGGSHVVRRPDGAEATEYAMDIVRVDADFDVEWRFEMPSATSAVSIAGTPDCGAIATFLTHEATMVGQEQIGGPAVGVLALDDSGRLRWARVLAMGGHFVATEPGRTGRVAVAMADAIRRDEQAQPPTEEWGIRLLVLGQGGETQAEVTRAWQHVSGLAWLQPGRVLLIGDRRGQPDPQRALLVDSGQGQQGAPREGEPSGVVGVLELIDLASGQSPWVREWERLTAGWEACPAAAPLASVAFIDMFPASDQRDADGRLPMRLVVLDGIDGSLLATRAFDASCGWLHLVLAEPRSSDWLLVEPARCGGYDNHPAAMVVERVGSDGSERWAEPFGEPLPPTVEPPSSPQARVHPSAGAVDEHGRLAVIGHGGYVSLAGARMTTDFEHFALVVEP